MINMEDLYRLLRTGHVQAQGIVDTVPDPLLVLDGALCVQSASRAFLEKFKVDRDDTIGKHIWQLGDGQWDIPALRSLLRDVITKANAVIDYEVRHDFPFIGNRTMLVTARTLHHPDGVSNSMLLSFVDVTERYQRADAQDTRYREVRHRIRNMLGVIQALARQTPAEGRTASEYRHDLLDRIGALVDADDMAFSAEGGASLAQVCERILAPFKGVPKAIVIEGGEDVRLGARTIMSLSLVLHEMATNAIKYGALSVASGELKVTCTLENPGNLVRLTWVERGGPTVTPPTETGFGSQLIQSTVAYSLGGQVKTEYNTNGLRAEFAIPL